jgi:cyclophilin family peptidyl-prolyl cis-trans isomerase
MYARSFQGIILLAAAVSFACVVAGCGGGDQSSQAPSANLSAGENPAAAGDVSEAGRTSPASEATDPGAPPKAQADLHPEVVFKTSEGTFKVKLDREKAPITVDNFLSNYVDKGYYDNTIFHQVEKGFMALAGAFTPEFEAKPTRAEIFCEAYNELKNRRGTIAMARDPGFPHTASNQFFFNLADNPGLDHVSRESSEEYGYCVFGEVVEGVEVLDRIAEVPVEDREGFHAVPARTVLIESVRQVR